MIIVEIKTGAPINDPPIHKIQLAVQGELLKKNKELNTPGLVKRVEKDKNGIEHHGYELNGKKITGITTYLSQFITWKYTDDYYAQRGKFLHRALQNLDEQPKWDWLLFLDEDMHNHPDREFTKVCIGNYFRFKDQFNLSGCQVFSEVPLASREMEVAATLDKIFVTPDSFGSIRMILLYLGKKFEAVEIKSRDVEFYLNGFRAARYMWESTRGKFTPPDALDDLEVIYNGKKIKYNLGKYIKERRKA